MSHSHHSIWLRMATVAGLALGLATPVLAQTAPARPAAPAAAPAAPVKPAAPDWLRTVSRTPEGGFVMGNPRARVSIIEYASFTCPHCAHFHETGIKPLKTNYIARGLVRYEFRNYVLNGPDMVASIIARCQGPQRFFPLADLFFSRQAEWLKGFQNISDADQRALQAMPLQQALGVMADKGGLVGFLRGRGIPKANIDRCLADTAGFTKLGDMQKVAYEQLNVRATPSFLINGKLDETIRDWPALEARVKALLR